MQKKELKQIKYNIRRYNKRIYYAKRKASKKRNKIIIHKSKRYHKKQEPSVTQIVKKRRKNYWKQINSKQKNVHLTQKRPVFFKASLLLVFSIY